MSSLVLLLALAPGFLNDLLFMRAATVVEWLAVDYGSKSLSLVVALSHPALLRSVAAALKQPPAPWISLLWAAGATVLALSSTIFLKPWLNWIFSSTVLFNYPRIESAWLYAFDMTFGLGLNATAEEMLYRALLPGLLAAFGWRPWWVVMISSIVFGLAHWSLGVGSVFDAFLAGVLLMIVVKRTGSLIPAIGAHYAIDAVLFA